MTDPTPFQVEVDTRTEGDTPFVANPPEPQATWQVKPGEEGLWHVALVNPDGTVAEWRPGTYVTEQAAQDTADALNALPAEEPE